MFCKISNCTKYFITFECKFMLEKVNAESNKLYYIDQNKEKKIALTIV